MVSKDICSVADVATGDVGSYDLVDATGTSIKIALIHTENDRWFAIHDRCSHGRIALSEGFVEGESIECARHGALFDLATEIP
ncbi:Rieske (2Fe-2S) protein [Arcanobacterium hippocoleae]|uniref:Rieske (2Fe-2S) protein n=1 Tax=Arcanobacterium hippocoleae TaxID=149017 RepID=UPI00333E9051